MRCGVFIEGTGSDEGRSSLFRFFRHRLRQCREREDARMLAGLETVEKDDRAVASPDRVVMTVLVRLVDLDEGRHTFRADWRGVDDLLHTGDIRGEWSRPLAHLDRIGEGDFRTGQNADRRHVGAG